MARPDADHRDAVINEATSGDRTIVAGVAGKQIVVVNYLLIAGGTVSVTWKSGSTAKSGALPLVVNSGASLPDARWFACGLGESLVLNLSGNVQVSGHLSYRLEPL